MGERGKMTGSYRQYLQTVVEVVDGTILSGAVSVSFVNIALYLLIFCAICNYLFHLFSWLFKVDLGKVNEVLPIITILTYSAYYSYKN